VRLAAVVIGLGGLVLAAHLTGLGDDLSRDALRSTVARAGPWGIPVFIGAFCLALLLHMPAGGITFVGLAVALYGRLPGGALAFAGGLVAVLVSFAVVRGIAGRPFAAVRNPIMRRMLDRLEARPLTTVVVLRILFFVGAPLNFALALSPLRPRDYVMGSVIGLLPPTFVLAAFFDLLFGGA
jgi:uncharacterized membrane protein YdjX (TVP38/TMEM64 family)